MKKSFGTKMKVWALGALAVIMGGTFTSCSDEIEESSRFTFKGELIADHLKNNPDKYSSFCKILKQAKTGKKSGNMLTTLSTYGAYTCFAPTNEAIDAYLNQKYEEYLEAVEQNTIDTTSVNIIKSPYLEDLSDSMAAVIAKNHIIQTDLRCPTMDTPEGAYPYKTMNRRAVTLSRTAKDSITSLRYPTVDGIVIAEQDIKTENGYVNRINGVLSPSDKTTSSLLASQPAFTLFNEALEKTGIAVKILNQYITDPDYDETLMSPVVFKTQGDKKQPYPVSHEQGFTLLVETDELLADSSKNSLGLSIQSIEDLEWFAANWYGVITDKAKQEFVHKGDYSNPENPLYKFIAYHIIDRKLLPGEGRGPGYFIMKGHQAFKDGKVNKDEFDSEKHFGAFDRYDYFETSLPYTSIKVTMPRNTGAGVEYIRYGGEVSSLDEEIIMNYTQDGGTRPCITKGMEHHVNVVVESPSTTKNRPNLENFEYQAINGSIFTIDKILIYNEKEMAGNILDERMRWDAISLFPELTTNDVRWKPKDNSYTMYYIPDGYSKRLKINNTSTYCWYLRPFTVGLGGYASYQGDELLVTGKYDFEYRLPHVPEGTYEVRFGFSCSDARGVVQFYIDGQSCGIPLDMRNTEQNLAIMGWYKNEEQMTDDEIRVKDKEMRNRDFMKAPASIFQTDLEKADECKNLRHASVALRHILKKDLEIRHGKEYWLRCKDVTEASSAGKPNELNQDYLELVPITIVNNQTNPEDRY